MIDIRIEEEVTYQIIRVKGEVDASTSIELDNAINDSTQKEKNILIDLTELDYISSAGLGVFISYIEELKLKNLKLVIFGLQEKVLEVFQILGLQHIMTIADNEKTALAQTDE